MALKITAKRNGFRRAGMAHPDHAVVHPDGTFSAAQVEQLKADPMLVVDEVEEPAGESLPTKKAPLQAWLSERGVAFEEGDTVAQLTERAQAHLQAGQ